MKVMKCSFIATFPPYNLSFPLPTREAQIKGVKWRNHQQEDHGAQTRHSLRYCDSAAQWVKNALNFVIFVPTFMKYTFTKAQEIWLIQRSAFLSPTQLRRAFIKQFLKYEDHREAPHRNAFKRLVKRFTDTGGVTGRSKEPEATIVTKENIARVEEYFEQNPKNHIRDAAFDLDIGVTSIWRILRLQLKWKPYRPIRVNKLTEQNMADRRDFSEWFLSQDEDFAQRVIWTDEKFFVMHQSPNMKNDVMWGPWNPEEEVECKRQGDTKVMAWCGMVDGKMLAVRWMIDESGRPASVDSDRYQATIQQVWAEVRNRSSRRHFWWMQDGATSHVTNVNLNFLVEKFRGRVISRRSEQMWPPYSPCLNPLDFSIWGYMQNQVRRIQPSTIEELMAAVEDVAATIPEEMVRAAAANVRKRCEACLEADGGHFEYFLS